MQHLVKATAPENEAILEGMLVASPRTTATSVPESRSSSALKPIVNLNRGEPLMPRAQQVGGQAGTRTHLQHIRTRILMSLKTQGTMPFLAKNSSSPPSGTATGVFDSCATPARRLSRQYEPPGGHNALLFSHCTL